MESISQAPTEPGFVQDPYPFYDRARGRGGMVFWEDYDMPVAFGHAAATACLKSRDMGRAAADGVRPTAPEHLRAFERLEANSLLELDGPRHARIRRLLVTAFTTSRIAAMAPMIARLAEDLVADLPGEPFDLIDRFAEPFPVTVIARLFGVPDDMGPDFLRWSHAMVAMYQARRDRAVEDAAEAASEDFWRYLLDYIAFRRTRPADDLLSALIAAEATGEGLSLEELVSTAVLLLNAGHEATVHSIGNGLHTLLRLDQPFETVSPDRVAATVEEVLRFEPPLHLFTRVVHRETTVSGHFLAAGTRIGVCLGAANRDGAVWTDPERFDPERPARPHISFGAGAHFCVGAPLARLELRIALAALHSPALSLKLTESPRYADLYHFHGLDRLMVQRSA